MMIVFQWFQCLTLFSAWAIIERAERKSRLWREKDNRNGSVAKRKMENKTHVFILVWRSQAYFRLLFYWQVHAHHTTKCSQFIKDIKFRVLKGKKKWMECQWGWERNGNRRGIMKHSRCQRDQKHQNCSLVQHWDFECWHSRLNVDSFKIRVCHSMTEVIGWRKTRSNSYHKNGKYISLLKRDRKNNLCMQWLSINLNYTTFISSNCKIRHTTASL